MSAIDPERWQVLSSYLDQALAMPEEERAAWVRSLRRRNVSVIADIEALLEEHLLLQREGFLEVAPESPGHGSHGGARRASPGRGSDR